jgi:hypothetical protein
MSTLEKMAYFQNRRDEVPNQLLAKELAVTKDLDGIREIADNLGSTNKNIRSDCLKVLYEIGYLDPDLIIDYGQEFLKLLQSKDNRMVWGAMIGLASIADHYTKEIWDQIDSITRIIKKGTIITQLWGMRVLAVVAASNDKYKKKIFPFLVDQIRTCLPRDVATHTESILRAVDEQNKAGLMTVLEMRKPELTPSQLARYKKVIKKINQIG